MTTESQTDGEKGRVEEQPTPDELLVGLNKRDESRVTLTLRDRFLAWFMGDGDQDSTAPALPPGTVSAKVS
jgi:hypothetical protein